MTTAKRYGFGWLLLLLAAMPLLVSVYLQVKQWHVQAEMKEALEKAALQTVHITGEPQWAEASKEIWIDGQLFDVKSIITTENGYIVTGLFDYTETGIKKTAARQSNEQNGGVKTSVWQLLLLPFYPTVTINTTISSTIINSRKSYINFNTPLSYSCLGVLTPPPNMA